MSCYLSNDCKCKRELTDYSIPGIIKRLSGFPNIAWATRVESHLELICFVHDDSTSERVLA